MDARHLPDCTAAATLSGSWHWTDPADGNAMLGDHTRGQSWQAGQLIAPPSDATPQPEWLALLQAWRRSCEQPLRLNESRAIGRMDEMAWVRTAFTHVQMHPFDKYFYSKEDGYTVTRWLEDLRARFGGVDAALIWPTYPNLGVDDRNAYDMIRSLPGGIDRLRHLVLSLIHI